MFSRRNCYKTDDLLKKTCDHECVLVSPQEVKGQGWWRQGHGMEIMTCMT